MRPLQSARILLQDLHRNSVQNICLHGRYVSLTPARTKPKTESQRARSRPSRAWPEDSEPACIRMENMFVYIYYIYTQTCVYVCVYTYVYIYQCIAKRICYIYIYIQYSCMYPPPCRQGTSGVSLIMGPFFQSLSNPGTALLREHMGSSRKSRELPGYPV